MSKPNSLNPSSPRTRGPIATDVSCEDRPLPHRQTTAARRMGPRVRREDVLRLLFGLMALIFAALATASPAAAHPHVWITAKSEMVYAPDGSITGVRHAWTFDDVFSTYALQGIETKTKGVYTKEQLAPLAQTNVESLKEFNFFTFAKTDGRKAKFKLQGRICSVPIHNRIQRCGDRQPRMSAGIVPWYKPLAVDPMHLRWRA